MLKSLKGHEGMTQAIAFSRNGKLLASSGKIAQLSGHSDLVNAIALSPDGKRLASGSADKTVKIWRIEVL
ncbi:WD40 repeat domain-containing protein [Altericista sp. CCNU0014]|uniref:WD40 repeat domain-containing protein n=1 Tax=Altericista sp. CCNU0014 TaxID=3082949 RepID=UPI00384FDF6B